MQPTGEATICAAGLRFSRDACDGTARCRRRRLRRLVGEGILSAGQRGRRGHRRRLRAEDWQGCRDRLPAPEDSLEKVQAALEAGRPPDFLFGLVADTGLDQWAYEGRLVDLTDAVGPLASLFDADALDASTLLNGRTGKRALYTLPMGRATNHIHVWKSLLERAGFTLADIPKEWEAFWSFWCERVQPAVRKATGRDDIWGVGLPMSVEAGDTHVQVRQFQYAYDAYW